MNLRSHYFVPLVSTVILNMAHSQEGPRTPCCENGQAEGLTITDSTGVIQWPLCTSGSVPITCKECVDRTRDDKICGQNPGSMFTKMSGNPYPRYYAVTSPIGLSPMALVFRAYQGGSNPPSQTLSITNNVYSRWSIDHDLSWDASESFDWLALSATSGYAYGTTPTPINANVNIAGKDVGTYSGNIDFSSSMVSSLQNTTVPASLTIAAQLSIAINGSTELEVNETGSWIAGVYGGFTPFHYQWYYRLVCDQLQEGPQPLKPPCGYWFTVGSDGPSWSHADNQDFR